MKLYSYWRSSAAYRVRIALNLKQLDYEQVSCQLAEGEQRQPGYLELNPQGLVPALQHQDHVLVQSLAIIEYLDSLAPQPRLLPEDPLARARVNAMAQTVACEVHPLNNLRVMQYLRQQMGLDDAAIQAWYAHWINQGFSALEHWAGQYSASGDYLVGDSVSLADVCLVPQMYNARRFKVSLEAYPRLVAADAHLQTLPAFAEAAPERQPDAA